MVLLNKKQDNFHTGEYMLKSFVDKEVVCFYLPTMEIITDRCTNFNIHKISVNNDHRLSATQYLDSLESDLKLAREFVKLCLSNS